MKKSIFFLITFGMIQNSMAAAKVVAACDGYKLSQDVASSYFAGILHSQNTYEIIDLSGDSLPATIELSSEGAVLKSSKAVKVNQNTGGLAPRLVEIRG